MAVAWAAGNAVRPRVRYTCPTWVNTPTPTSHSSSLAVGSTGSRATRGRVKGRATSGK